jgi:hypothetical protein
MKNAPSLTLALALCGAAMVFGAMPVPTLAQEQAAAVAPETRTPEPLTPEELEILVARIALYPDELVAVITAASLFPLQIVEAQRFLDQVAKKPDLKPKAEWDGSVVSLLNYPEIIAMMSDDLDWTQMLGEAISYQQKDLLVAIQQLRERAVAQGVIKTDEKVVVVQQQDAIVIQPAQPEVIYVPQYEPAMLYDPGYVAAPISYYPTAYPHYWDPVAPFFAGVVTGAVWAAAVDWDDWGVWGGNNWGNDIDIDCNNCFNNVDFNGKVNINDVDWKNVDRSKINFDKNQFTKINSTSITNNLKQNNVNSLQNKARDVNKTRPAGRPASLDKGGKDVRTSTLEGLKGGNKGNLGGQGGNKGNLGGQGGSNKLGGGQGGNRADLGNKAGGNRGGGQSMDFDRPVGKPKPASRPDNRSRDVSPMGDKGRGADVKMNSNRGAKSMGGGGAKRPDANRGGGGGHKQVKRGGGGGGKGGGGGGRGGRR